jgi:oxygen-independent coproporphyrinogen-3 oxidase
MYLQAMTRLDAAGYEQYEISNVARRGTRVSSQPEILDRRRVAWLGCGAHSTRGGVRWKNLSSTTEYIAAVASGRPLAVERRVLIAREALEEALFTGLRLTRGIDRQYRQGSIWCRCLGYLSPSAGTIPRGGCLDL